MECVMFTITIRLTATERWTMLAGAGQILWQTKRLKYRALRYQALIPMVNVLFLINIVRLLIMKLRQMPEADQSRKATRATLILVPLLGLQNLLIPIRPEEGSNLHEAFHIAVALFTSLQVAFVLTMYCFCYSEVIQVLRRRWNQHKLLYRSSTRGSNTHATTYTTTEHVTQVNATYFSTADNKEPPLEMSKI